MSRKSLFLPALLLSFFLAGQVRAANCQIDMAVIDGIEYSLADASTDYWYVSDYVDSTTDVVIPRSIYSTAQGGNYYVRNYFYNDSCWQNGAGVLQNKGLTSLDLGFVDGIQNRFAADNPSLSNNLVVPDVYMGGIGDEAFARTGITKVRFASPTPPSTFGTNVFSNPSDEMGKGLTIFLINEQAESYYRNNPNVTALFDAADRICVDSNSNWICDDDPTPAPTPTPAPASATSIVNLHLGGYISLNCTNQVDLFLPGGYGETERDMACNVMTNNPQGYTIEASSSAALVNGGATVLNLGADSSAPAVLSQTGSGARWAITADSAGNHFSNPVWFSYGQISSSGAVSAPTGDDYTYRVGASVGANAILLPGTYTGTLTFTATSIDQ